MEEPSSFAKALSEHQINLVRKPLTTLQINVGKFCNQACHHCHVEASPKRTEKMTLATMNRLLALLQTSPTIHTIDITGGAPELHEVFRPLVKKARQLGLKVIDRCNLTVFFEPGQEDTAQFLADHQVEIVASLPCYTKDNVDKQRGSGVFKKSIDALKLLGSLGYGRKGSGLILNLVYNPLGASLPPSQLKLEADYKQELKELFDIEFNGLFTITNMPIKRFLDDLNRQNKLTEYMQLLIDNFNPQAADDVMCRELVSIGFDGQIYDCDFNQMLEMPINFSPKTIWDIESLDELSKDPIAFANHCFGCTAGAGSSCGGSLA
jgi:radical SAM/Cys-rich protein